MLELLWGEAKRRRGGLPRAVGGRGPRADPPAMTASTPRAARPLDLAGLRLRNRIVGTAHGRGLVEDGAAAAR